MDQRPREFPLLQRLGNLPITIGGCVSGIRSTNPRSHPPALEASGISNSGSHSAGGTAKQIPAPSSRLHLSDTAYRLNPLRYDLRKLESHGLLAAVTAPDYTYRLTPKGFRSRCAFVLPQRLCGPLANSRSINAPTRSPPASKLEAAYHRANQAIQQIVDLLAA